MKMEIENQKELDDHSNFSYLSENSSNYMNKLTTKMNNMMAVFEIEVF